MNERFEQGIGGARRAVRELRDAVGPGAGVNAALTELETAVEELEVLAEELELQNEELAATQHELAVEERAYRELFELAPDPYLVTDADGRIEDANRAAADLLGVPRHLLEGRVLAGFVQPETRKEFRRGLLALARNGHARDWDLTIHPRRSPPLIVAAEVNPARDAAGDVCGLRWVLRDVTAARRAQQALQQAFNEATEDYAQLRDIDRWKDAFLAAAAHDLRSPLAVITTGAETLATKPDAGEDVAGIATRIFDHAVRLGRLLDDLLDLDRFTRGAITADRTETDVLALVEDVVEHLDLTGHSVEVRGASVSADLDPLRVEQIVQNLLLNAATHTEPGTPIHVWVVGDRDGVTITVEDEGPGVPTEVRDDLFLPFISVPSHPGDRGGAGIGLSLVNLFAQLHGGQVRVEDREGGGARFVVELPGH